MVLWRFIRAVAKCGSDPVLKILEKGRKGGGAAAGGGSAKRRRMIDAPARNGEVEEVREANEGRAG